MNSHQFNQDKFTPGPWYVSRDTRPGMEWNNHIASVEEPHLEICSMFHTNELDDNETGEANAHLVAAAPELLDALRRSLNWLSSYPGGLSLDAYEQARAAIDKAEGRK